MPIDRATNLVAPVSDDAVQRRPLYRSFIRFLFSNLGLIIVVIAYSVGGAFLFILLEQYIELQNCQQASITESISITNLSETMFNYVSFALEDKNTTAMHEEVANNLRNFTGDVYLRKSQLRFNGQNCSNSSSWNFPSALLFSITVITTIGYGHITPTSWEGQITCICYALIGIPIFLLCLANISSVLGDVFRFMYSGLLHCLCCICRSYTRKRHRKNHQFHVGNMNAPRDINHEGKTTMIDPTWPEAHNYINKNRNLDHNNEQEDDDYDDDIWDRMESRVPFGAVILIIVGYISLGALMFNKFEGWSFIESVYFCYITLATIGFGDFVPGITSGSSTLRFLPASFYILFGLAILAMCFDLIKESIVDKFHWIGIKLGIVEPDGEEIGENHVRYANFEYDTSNSQQDQLQTRINNGKPQSAKISSNNALDERRRSNKTPIKTESTLNNSNNEKQKQTNDK